MDYSNVLDSPTRHDSKGGGSHISTGLLLFSPMVDISIVDIKSMHRCNYICHNNGGIIGIISIRTMQLIEAKRPWTSHRESRGTRPRVWDSVLNVFEL